MNAEVFSTDVQELVSLFAEHQVRYVLIGGTAVIYHGYARLTGDVDFLYDPSPKNVARLWAALSEFWGGVVPAISDPRELEDPKIEDPKIVVQFGRPPNRIDLIAGLPAVPFKDAWRNRVRESIDVSKNEVPVWILGLAELRRSKMHAGRPKDQDDLEHLPEIWSQRDPLFSALSCPAQLQEMALVRQRNAPTGNAGALARPSAEMRSPASPLRRKAVWFMRAMKKGCD